MFLVGKDRPSPKEKTMKKHIVEYSTENPAYKESRGMFKAVCVFLLVLLIVSFL